MVGQAPGDLTPPTELRPPAPGADAGRPRSHVWFWALLTLLLLVALAVVFVLPIMLVPPQQAVPPEPAPPATAGTGAQREQAQQTLQDYLQLRARLEMDNAAAWGEPDWSASAADTSSGDRYFAQRQFAAAEREYREGFERLQRLQQDRGRMLTEALEKGAGALAADDVVRAIEAFEAALRIEPQQAEALTGIANAQRRARAIEQMELGRAAETNNQPEIARAAYQAAVDQDKSYAAAVDALKRVSSAIDAQAFKRAMSAVLQALDAGRTKAAGEALAQAAGLRPNDPAVEDARRRLQAMRAQAGLDQLRRQAQRKVRTEEWQAAVGLYQKALAIDASAGFARNGLDRAEQRVSLHRQLDHYLDRPNRLFAAAPLANAEKLLGAASDAPSTEPRLAGKIERLRELVSEARTPVRVTLQSDGQTDVMVYRVARLGRLQTHQLDLRPGDYTVVGSRAGYRDVRKVIRVRPGVAMAPVMIRCEETI